MTEIIMNNVREKLSNARELCPGMSEEIYAITDYMATVANESLVPQGLAVCLFLVKYDIQNGKSGFATGRNAELPQYLRDNKNQVLRQLVYIPQVIDEIAEPDFAKAFRDICKVILDIDPPKRVKVDWDKEFPEYVKVAVDWWANAVASPKLDNGENLPVGLMTLISRTGKRYSKDEMKIFKNTLAERIVERLEYDEICYLHVDYRPCALLEEAGSKIGIDSMMGYPWKTRMEISKRKVEVSNGYQAPYETIWTKKSNRD